MTPKVTHIATAASTPALPFSSIYTRSNAPEPLSTASSIRLDNSSPLHSINKETSNRKPIATVDLCIYPGRSAISRGHSFITLTPQSPLGFHSGSWEVLGEKGNGPIAIGLAAKGEKSSDRIWDRLTLRGSPAQLRDDKRYLLQKMKGIKKITLEISDPIQLSNGIQKINQDYKALGGTCNYINRVNELQLPEASPSESKVPLSYHFRHHNSNDYSISLFDAFGGSELLAKAIQAPIYTGMDSKSFSHNIDTASTPTHPIAQTFSRLDPSIIEMRRLAPQAIANSKFILELLQSDIDHYTGQFTNLIRDIKGICNTYENDLIILLNALQAGWQAGHGEQPLDLSQALDMLHKTFNHLGKIAEDFERSDHVAGLLIDTLSAISSSDSRDTAFSLFGKLRDYFQVMDRSVTAFNESIKAHPGTLDRIYQMTHEIKSLYQRDGKAMIDLTADFVERLKEVLNLFIMGIDILTTRKSQQQSGC